LELPAGTAPPAQRDAAPARDSSASRMHAPLRLLLIGSTPPLAAFAQRHCGAGSLASADAASTLQEAEAMLCGDLAYDAIVLDAAGVVVAAAAVEAIATRAALALAAVQPDAAPTPACL